MEKSNNLGRPLMAALALVAGLGVGCENFIDTDGDGLSDYAERTIHYTRLDNPDSDDDGLSDYDEVNLYQTSPNLMYTRASCRQRIYCTFVSDLSDGLKVKLGLNPLQFAYPSNVYKSLHTGAFPSVEDADLDRDGLILAEELERGTDPFNADTDGDGLSDSEEINISRTSPLLEDTDEDGLKDGLEISLGTDPLNSDTDGDGLSDGEDYWNRLDPLNPDSDGDGLGDELDYETNNCLDPPYDQYADQDGDGLTNNREMNPPDDKLPTLPCNSDTDQDGLGDGYEVRHGTDPLMRDTDRDGLKDGLEIKHGTDPLIWNRDDYFVKRGMLPPRGQRHVWAFLEAQGMQLSSDQP